MEILKGLPVANAINEKLMEQVKSIEGPLPHLAIIRVGERPDDCSYERGAVKKMDKVGVRCTTYTFDADIDNDTFQAEFDKINENPDIDGILMLRPLPKQLDEKQIENKFSVWSLLFLPVKDWAKLPLAIEQSSVPSPAKAPDDKGCRTLRSATKDAVFGICELFEKSSTKNFSISPNERV